MNRRTRPRSNMGARIGAMVIGICLACVPAPGQGEEPDTPGPGSTVLAPPFGEKLALPRIGWPSAAEQQAARDAPTQGARASAVDWLIELLLPQWRPFATDPLDAPPNVRRRLGSARPAEMKYRERLTAAISEDGDDLMCARWSTSEYRFQFIGAQELIRLSIEPVRAGPREALTGEQAVARVRELLDRVLNDSGRLLNFCTLQAEPTAYGYRVAVHCDDLEDRQAWQRQFRPDETSVYHEWALHLVVHTDGVSYVLDVLPMTSVNVVGHGGKPVQRWFSPPRAAASQPAPTTAPALDPAELQAKLKLVKELLDQKRREQEAREGQKQPQP